MSHKPIKPVSYFIWLGIGMVVAIAAFFGVLMWGLNEFLSW